MCTRGQQAAPASRARTHSPARTHSMGCCMRTARVHVVYVCDMSTLKGAHSELHLHRNGTSARSAPAYYSRVNTRTSSPLVSPQRLSVSSSMTPGRRARARSEHLDRRLKVPDGERRSGPAPVISCQPPAAAPPKGAHFRCLPGRPRFSARALRCPRSALLCPALRLESGPPYSLPVKLSDDIFGPGPSVAPPVIVRGNKIKNYASSSRCGDLPRGPAATCLGGSTRAPHHARPPPSPPPPPQPQPQPHLPERVQTQKYLLHRPPSSIVTVYGA